MVVGDHDRLGHSRAYKSPIAVHHGEVDVESDFFSMMAAVAGDAKGKYHRASREIENFRAIELNDVRRVLMVFARLGSVPFARIRVRTCRTNTSSKFLGDPFGLS